MFGVVGMGLSGVAARDLLLAMGESPSSIVTFDSRPGKADFSDPKAFLKQNALKTLVVSPGVPLSTPWIRQAFDAGMTLTSELEIACACLEGERLVGVTGSVGKSTTTSLIGAGLQVVDQDAFVGGNLGVPLARYMADVLTHIRPRARWVVLELSSYQLELAQNLSVEVGVLTSLQPNHMERYSSLNEYYRAKWHLMEVASKHVVNIEGADAASYAKRVSLKSKKSNLKRICFVSRKQNTLLTQSDFAGARLMGSHNKDNLAVAAKTLQLAGLWDDSVKTALLDFSGLPHRFQSLGRFQGVHFINDSKATAMGSVLAAWNAFRDDFPQKPLWLLLGGRDKNLPWNELKILKSDKHLQIVFFGECASLAQSQSKLTGLSVRSLKDCVSLLKEKVRSGDTVLLSPGGTSLDEFQNFEDRGLCFERFVKEEFES
jgi:UDP-N-acetylmuramoylalanine--D-glutamate ligase